MILALLMREALQLVKQIRILNQAIIAVQIILAALEIGWSALRHRLYAFLEIRTRTQSTLFCQFMFRCGDNRLRQTLAQGAPDSVHRQWAGHGNLSG
jgi:hypothetical protein